MHTLFFSKIEDDMRKIVIFKVLARFYMKIFKFHTNEKIFFHLYIFPPPPHTHIIKKNPHITLPYLYPYLILPLPYLTSPYIYLLYLTLPYPYLYLTFTLPLSYLYLTLSIPYLTFTLSYLYLTLSPYLYFT